MQQGYQELVLIPGQGGGDAEENGWLAVSPLHYLSSLNPHPAQPSLHLLHPPVILGIYSCPPRVYKLNYLVGEIGSLHDRILFVPFGSIKINRVPTPP